MLDFELVQVHFKNDSTVEVVIRNKSLAEPKPVVFSGVLKRMPNPLNYYSPKEEWYPDGE